MTAEIIGRSCITSGANSPEELFELLRQQKCTVSEIPADRWDKARYWHPVPGTKGKTYTFAASVLDSIYDFDPGMFGMSKREAVFLDPQQRLILQLTWRALEDANISVPSLRNEKVGVYIGASSLDHGNLVVEDPAAAGPYFMTGNTLSVVSNRISHVFGLHGPSMTVDTACSSSLVALDMALGALNAGDIDMAIVGGVNVLSHPLAFVGFAQARMLSPAGLCRAYDEDGAGYVRSEGGAVLILRRTDKAIANNDRSHARIVASGVNSAGRTNGISMPSAEAQASLLQSIYTDGGIDVDRVAFVEGHGTGTGVGDPAEIWSIGTVVGKKRRQPIPIGSIKSNIGHTEPASGLHGLMKAMLALENNYLPASLHFETPNQEIDFRGLNVHVASKPIELLHGKQPRFAGINSFGFGGTNAHAVISDPMNGHAPELEKGAGKVFLASAHTAAGLEELLYAYRARLHGGSRKEKLGLIAASGANRTPMRKRFVVKSNDPERIVDAIGLHLKGAPCDDVEMADAVAEQAKVAFVFSGNGSQWAGMGLDAFNNNDDFRERFSVVSALFQISSNISLTELLFDAGLKDKLADTRIAQPLLFAIQASLSDALVKQGIAPAAVFGHSVGEVAAAYASGAVSLVDAVSIVAKRSLHQSHLAGRGKMAVVVLGPDDALAFARSCGLDDLCVAASNTHNSVTMSGSSEDIEALREHGRAARIPVHVLDIDYPFHHPLIESAKDAFLEDLPQISLRKCETPYISTVTGGRLEGTSLGPTYWWQNVREPVRFHEATQAAIAQGCTLFLEIGPRPILSSYLKETIKQLGAPGVAVATLLRDETGRTSDPVSRAFSRAVAHGAAFDTKRVFGSRNAFIELPNLPFDTTDLRATPTSDAIDLYGRTVAGDHSLAGWRIDPNGGSWKNHIDAHLYPDLAEHVVDGNPILPGSAFAEIAVAAAQRFYGCQQVDISNMEITRPLELSSSRIMEISTVISGSGNLEIRSRERLSEDDWTVHAVARCRKLTIGDSNETASAVTGRVTKIVSGAAAYETARSFGLNYGPKFQLLESAALHGERRIVATLKAPGKAGNPFVSYSLNPISVDAAFHGLVALYSDLSGDAGGSPYIPVRFGCVRVYLSGETIARGCIEIERVSQNSIKANFRLQAADGRTIATFEDCRFKRASLSQQKNLEALSFHYTTVGSATLAGANAPEAGKIAPGFLATSQRQAPDNSTLLINAAVYRACHDIAMKAGKSSTGQIRPAELPHDFAFRCFLTSCLYTLEDAGLARHNGDTWSVEPECALPPVGDILRELLNDRPDRIAEAVLVNNSHFEALERLDDLAARRRDAGGEPAADAGKQAFAGEATLEQQRIHSVASKARLALAGTAFEAALTAATASRAGHARIVELCSVSRAMTSTLARLAAEQGAALIVVEPDERTRHDLEIAFETSAHVSVLSPSDLDGITSVDLVVSASDAAFRFLDSELALRVSISRLLGAGGRLMIAASGPSLLSDFALGLTEGWFAASQDAEFPVGELSPVSEWQKLAERIGLADANVALHELPYGPVITLDGRMAASDEAKASATFGSALLLHGGALDEAELSGLTGLGIARLELSGDSERDRAAISAALAGLPAGGETVLFYVPGALSGRDGSTALQDGVSDLSAIALSLAQSDGKAGDAARPRLGVLLPFGAPVAHPGGDDTLRAVNAGLWTFLRVLNNEYGFIDLKSFDFSGHSNTALGDRIGLVLEIFASRSVNREWSVDPATDALMEIRAVPGPSDAEQAATRDFSAATIRQKTASQVSSIVWEACERPQPGVGEVEIEVAATGLNFRDVMWAMGVLPEEALEDGFAGATIGMECSGRVVAIGDGVAQFSVGDPVMAIAPAAFSTHVVVSELGVAKLPESVDLIAGATLPVAFLTAYYAMVELGRIKPGETILIHGGAGGVGLAAIQLAKSLGATVIATAGTQEKRRLLTMLGADHVFDSRSLDFVNAVLGVTGQQGVDLVLNSLFAEAMERSLSLVKPFGRFLELGKRDYYADSKIGLRPFRRNISYFGIDADQLLSKQPALSARLFSEIAALFERGQLYPLPYRAFAASEIDAAFRLMQGSGHIGKILVSPPLSGHDTVSTRPAGAMKLDGDGVHLVVGGIGGFGLAAAGWLVEKGARRIALCSRSGTADEATRAAMAKWAAGGVIASVHSCDVTKEADVAALLEKLRESAPLKGVVHAAMVLDDALIGNLSRERNRPVIDTKAKGAAILDRLTRADRLDHFILFSSATTLIGNPGQANYVAANGYLEGLARARRLQGLPGLAIGFGAISDTGFLSRNNDVSETLSKRLGKSGLAARQALEQVATYIARDPGTADAAVVMIAEIDWASARSLENADTPLFAVIMRTLNNQGSGVEGDGIDLKALVAGKSAQEAEQLIYDVIAGEIAAVLRISTSEISRTRILKEIGLDSLMAMELGMNFQQKTGFTLPLSSVSDTTTVGDIAQKLCQKVTSAESHSEAADASQGAEVVNQLAARHAESALEKAAGT